MDAHAHPAHAHPQSNASTSSASNLAAAAHHAVDPVCGMDVDPSTALHRATHDGRDFYFCSEHCRTSFLSDPSRWVHADEATPNVTAKHADEEVEYTCPMHPQVVQKGPGACPLCGMALEPRVVRAIEPENPELVDMQRRFVVSTILAVPLLLLAMSDVVVGDLFLRWVSPRALQWVELALATPVVLWGGWPFFQRMARSIVARAPNMFTLIGLGTVGGKTPGARTATKL